MFAVAFGKSAVAREAAQGVAGFAGGFVGDQTSQLSAMAVGLQDPAEYSVSRSMRAGAIGAGIAVGVGRAEAAWRARTARGPVPSQISIPQTGSLFERTFQTSKGPVGFLAEVEVRGKTLHLQDAVIYGEGVTPLTGLTKEVLAARTQLITEARAMGFERLRITGHRVASSSSANPGHLVDLSIDLSE
jgi:hypothetical protein